MSAVGFFNLLTTPAPISASNPPLRFLISQRLKSTSSNCNISDAFIFTTLQTPSLRTAISSMADFDYSFVNPAVAEIIVVRHGETAWNADGRIQGHLDVELNEAGRQQAVAVANRLAKEPPLSAVYSSDLKRALETAQIIATTCGNLEVITDPDLRERNLGDLQGLVYREAVLTNPEASEALRSHRSDQTIPGGGESLDQLYQRCTSSLQKIGNKHRGQRVVVVSHGGTIRALWKRAHPHRHGGGGKILNTSVNVFHLSDGDKWKIKTWGDVSHLDQTDYLQSGFGGDKNSG
ncbi:hypothetical protein IC582_024847 [Cucumis melo]|uniref:Phosphoglycerate mutase-like protein 4 n=2 Tax=Cucumis melo TaxID=3656 RepID=A0A1S3C624_CUCME|nr:phosphoglycerate mutase-like protein 4 [Cucumis melo]KAA0045862.1 phosphoglycerate mutase-like protein 4 [Cucumis melo var. makuwa]TYK13726.1 phosphoglycerate mutase-like protein 4 [Cucumis melo var. makuwa]